MKFKIKRKKRNKYLHLKSIKFKTKSLLNGNTKDVESVFVSKRVWRVDKRRKGERRARGEDGHGDKA